MIKLDNESYNRKIRLTESINNKIINEDEDFEKWFDQKMSDFNKAYHSVKFSNFKNIKVHSLDVPLEKQDGKHTYTYVEDFNTGQKIIKYCVDYFKNYGFTITNHKQVQSVNKIYKEKDQYESLYNENQKFLSNGIFSCYINEKTDSDKKGKITFNVAINSIKIDAPEFDEFDYTNHHFIVCIESNALRARHVNEEKIEELLDKFFEGLDKIIGSNSNWQQKINIKTNAEIDAEG